jgi:hypothetical protein
MCTTSWSALTCTLCTLDPVPLCYLNPIQPLLWHIYIVKPATSLDHPRISLVPPVLSLKPVLFSCLVISILFHQLYASLRKGRKNYRHVIQYLRRIQYEGKLIYFWIFIQKEGVVSTGNFHFYLAASRSYCRMMFCQVIFNLPEALLTC